MEFMKKISPGSSTLIALFTIGLLWTIKYLLVELFDCNHIICDKFTYVVYICMFFVITALSIKLFVRDYYCYTEQGSNLRPN